MSKKKEPTDYVGLVRLKDIPGFARWLSDDFHGWTQQCPESGECMRLWRWDMEPFVVKWDGRRTVCGRFAAALYHTYLCFRDG